MNPHQKRKVFKSVNFEFQSVDPQLDVTEGDFGSGGAAWTLDPGWAVSGGKAVLSSSSAAYISQDVSSLVKTGYSYKVKYTMSAYSSGECYASLGGSALSDPVSSDGANEQVLECGASATLIIGNIADAAASYSIDDVSVTAVNIFHVPYGTAMLEIRPQGAVQVKIDGDTIAVDLAANEWSTQFHFNPDGLTSHYIEITNGTSGIVECHIHCLIDPDLNPDEDESA